jgi:hypothetical protein
LATRPGDAAWKLANPEPVPDGAGVIYQYRPWVSRDPSLAEIRVLDLRTGKSKTLARGIQAKLTRSGHLLIAQADGSLLAAPFDSRSLTLTRTPVKVVDSLEVRMGWTLGASFEISDNGTFVFVQSAPITEDTVVFVGRDGKTVGRSFTWGGWIVDAPAVSPDSRRWAVSVHRGQSAPNIWVRDGDARQERPLTFGEDLDYSPGFLSDGRDVAFVGPRNGNNWDLYRVPFDGSADPVRLLDRPGDIQRPRFTADGRWVVFCERNRYGESQIVAHRFAGDSVTIAFRTHKANECTPDIAQGGKWMAYTSTESGRTEVWIRPFPDSGGTPRQVSTAGGDWPRFSANGRELYFVDARNEIVAVPVTAGSTLELGAPRTIVALDERATWAGGLLPDDKGFIIVRKRLEAPGHVIMIRNFFELLRTKVIR